MNKSAFLLLAFGFFLGASDVEMREIINDNSTIFLILIIGVFIQVGFEIIALAAKIRKRWLKNDELKAWRKKINEMAVREFKP